MLSVERVDRIGKSVILYDDSLVNHMREEWFDPDHWSGAPRAPGYAGGRGATLFISCEGQDWVLRHYHRGGRVARLARDGFVWLGAQRSRPFREWRLLHWMQARGLPAPRPVAARYLRSGLLYTADLITVRLPGVVPLSTRIARGRLAASLWQRVGKCVGQFHAAGVFHADLTVHNLQVGNTDEVYLLDFDRGRIMPAGGNWRQRNLERLQRSLVKVSAGASQDHVPEDWAAFLDGYRGYQPPA